MAKAILGSFAVHLAAFALAFLTAFMSTSDYDDGSAAARLENDGAPRDAAIVLEYLSDARGELIGWMLPLFIIGLVCTLIFLLRTERDKADHETRDKHTLFWTMMLFVSLIIGLGLMVLQLIRPEVLWAVADGSVPMVLAVSMLLLGIAYYVSTVLFVKRLFVPSVPLASMVRGI